MSDTTTEREFEMIRELREALGLFAGAMPISPEEAWREAIDTVKGIIEVLDEADV